MQVSWYCDQLKRHTMHILLNQISGLFASHETNSLKNSELQVNYTNYRGFGHIFGQMYDGTGPANIAGFSQHELPLSALPLASSVSVLNEIQLPMNDSEENTSQYKNLIDSQESGIENQVFSTTQLPLPVENPVKAPGGRYILSYNYALLSSPVNLTKENLFQSDSTTNNQEITTPEKPISSLISADYFQLSARNKLEDNQYGHQALLNETKNSVHYSKDALYDNGNVAVKMSRNTEPAQAVDSLRALTGISNSDGVETKNNSVYIKSINDLNANVDSYTDKHNPLSDAADMAKQNRQTKPVIFPVTSGNNVDIDQNLATSISSNDIDVIKTQGIADTKELPNNLIQSHQNRMTDRDIREINSGLAVIRDGENYSVEKSVSPSVLSHSLIDKQLNHSATRPVNDNIKVTDEMYNHYPDTERQPLTGKLQHNQVINSDAPITIATTNEQIDSIKTMPSEVTDNKPVNQVSVIDTSNTAGRTSSVDRPIIQLSGGLDETGSEQIANQIVWAKNNNNHVKISLSPEHLGSLEINIERDKDGFNIQFTTQNTAAKEAIESFIPKLRDMLDQQGLNLQNTNVSSQEKGQDESYSSAQLSENNEEILDEHPDDKELTQAVNTKPSSSYLLEAFA